MEGEKHLGNVGEVGNAGVGDDSAGGDRAGGPCQCLAVEKWQTNDERFWRWGWWWQLQILWWCRH